MRINLVLVFILVSVINAACRPGAPTPPTPAPIRPAPSVTAAPATPVPPTLTRVLPTTTTAPPTTTREAATATQSPPTQAPPTQPPASPTIRPATPTPPTQAQAQPTLRPAASPTVVRPAGPTAPRPIVASSLRGMAWDTVLKTDPKLEYDASIPNFGQALGPYVRLRGATTTGVIEGHAVTNSILYGDISGDGREEAVIPLSSGGTAGLLGYLIYREIDGQPVLMTGLPGYKVAATIENGELRIVQPLYGANDANCCPSGVEETAYRLQADRLARVREPVNRGFPEMKRPVVERFYTLLAVKDYAQAYEQLSPAYKASRPFAQWAAGYQNTVAVDAKVLDRQDGLVGVDLTATDRTANGQVTRRFSGTWALVWSPEKKQWLMERGVLNEVR